MVVDSSIRSARTEGEAGRASCRARANGVEAAGVRGEVVVRGSWGSDSDLDVDAISYGIGGERIWVLERHGEGLTAVPIPHAP